MRKKVETVETKVQTEVNKLDEAKKILAENEQKIVEEAAKEFNEYVKKWTEKHNCRLSVWGEFIDSGIRTGIKIVRDTNQ